jgi:SAM-dependent methyltransferase
MSVVDFYDELADDYELLFADWDASVRRQAQILLPLVGEGPILDVAAGLGTQAIGLALAGRAVVARDLSPRLVERGRAQAARLGATLVAYEVGDMRQACAADRARFGAVIALDNALPHLEGDDELVAALAAGKSALAPGGAFVASIRDYDALARERPAFDEPRLLGQAPARRFVLQAWSWAADGRSYELEHLIVREGPAGWSVRSRKGRYRALLRRELDAAARTAGFATIEWLEPAATGFYQPIVRLR